MIEKPVTDKTTHVPPPSAVMTRPGHRDAGEAYVVEERLGASASAVVYRAKQADTGRNVRFKVLRSEAPEEVALDAHVLTQLFPQVAGLSHPHIAGWLDAYLDPDGFVLVHEFLDGVCGGSVPEKRPITGREALTVARQVCEALHAAELAGIPHGDIKPGNLLVATSGREGVHAQVQDWALTRGRQKPNEESLFFMAPERLRGGPPTVKADLFSLAATLCYLMTGFVPVQGADAEGLLEAWPHFDATVLADLREDLSEHFVKWLGWLIRLPVEDRPATAAQALEVLGQVIAYADARPAGAAAKVAAPKPAKVAPVPPRGPAPPTVERRAQGAAAAPVEKPAAPPQRGVLGKFVAFCGVMAVFLAVACAWLRIDWGPDWASELGRRWEQWSFENLPSSRGRSADSNPAPAPDPKPAAPEPPAPPVPTPKPAEAPKFASENFAYAEGKTLIGAMGGSNWVAPWRGKNANIGRSSDGKFFFASFGGEQDSDAERQAGPFGGFMSKSSMHVALTINHPGADAPEFKAWVRGIGAKDEGPTHLLITPQGGKLKLSISGSSEVVEAPAGKTLRIVMRYDVKKRRDGIYEMEIRAFLNPSAKSRSPLSGCPSSRRLLVGMKPPEQLVFAMEAKGGTRPVTVGSVRIGGQLGELLK